LKHLSGEGYESEKEIIKWGLHNIRVVGCIESKLGQKPVINNRYWEFRSFKKGETSLERSLILKIKIFENVRGGGGVGLWEKRGNRYATCGISETAPDKGMKNLVGPAR